MKIIEWLSENSLELFVGAVVGVVVWLRSPYKGGTVFGRLTSCATSVLTSAIVSVLAGGVLADKGLSENMVLAGAGIAAVAAGKVIDYFLENSDKVFKYITDKINPLN